MVNENECIHEFVEERSPGNGHIRIFCEKCGYVFLIE